MLNPAQRIILLLCYTEEGSVHAALRNEPHIIRNPEQKILCHGSGTRATTGAVYKNNYFAVCRFIWNLAKVLEGIQDDVPPHALPVAQELDSLVALASSKLQKYADRGFVSTVWHLRTEQVCQHILRTAINSDADLKQSLRMCL